MEDFNISITKRDRRRVINGQEKFYTRYYLNYNDPLTGKRKTPCFEKHKDAIAAKNQILLDVQQGTYVDQKAVPTVRDAVDNWLADREGEVKEHTMEYYRRMGVYIAGPLLSGTAEQRCEYTITGKLPEGCSLLPMLGDKKISDLTTAHIRRWYKQLSKEVGQYGANKSKAALSTILALAAEDFSIRVPAMPTSLGRSKRKEKKQLLTEQQVEALLLAAEQDDEKGIYYAWPFLTGTRASEQLGLLWEDVDLVRGVIHIRRMQELDGTLTDMTKTEAGTREIPICNRLMILLDKWVKHCPRKNGKLHRVFPGLGQRQKWPQPRVGGGGPLLYSNFRTRIWKPALKRLDLPSVGLHSARHYFISMLQAQGLEVGLVAKIVGHSSPAVTLGHYTQAVRGTEEATEALDRAYGASCGVRITQYPHRQQRVAARIQHRMDEQHQNV